MERRVNLLVHAGAASSRQHDERRATQAIAYMELNATRVSKVISFGAAVQSSSEASAQDDSTVMGLLNADVYIEDTQLAYAALETQLFRSSGTTKIPNTATKRAPTTPVKTFEPQASRRSPAQAPVEEERDRQSSFDQPRDRQSGFSTPTQLTPSLRRTVSGPSGSGNAQHVFRGPESQSSYLRSPVLTRRTKRAHLEDSRPSSSQQSYESVGPTSKRTKGELVSVWGLSEQTSWQNASSGNDIATNNESTSQMPTSYSLSDTAISSLGEGQQLSQHRGSDSHPESESAGQEPPRDTLSGHDFVSRTPEAPDLLAGPSNESTIANVGVPSSPADTEPGNKSSVENGKARAKAGVSATAFDRGATQLDQAELESQEILQRASREIRAPVPETSVQPFQTHVTRMLRNLVEDPVFQTTYEPAKILRPPDVHERGYWSIEWSVWPAKVKLDFWTQLDSLVGNGCAGWGVWCTRSQDVHLTDTDDLCQDTEAELYTAPSDCVKVWCWGEVAKHIYLLLYTISVGKVRRLGLKWIDSRGRVVLQMKEKTSRVIPAHKQ